MTFVHGAVTVCGLNVEEKQVAEIFNLNGKFGWKITGSNEIKQDFTSLREANLECLKYIKNNLSLDISKVKTAAIVKVNQKVIPSAMSNYRENFRRRTKLPTVHLTMPRLMKDPHWRRSHHF